MPVITFDAWDGGLDVRGSITDSKANILRVARNCYVTTGKKIKKRPCLQFVATLEAGTIGLKAFGGVLNTFYGAAAAITHANPLFVARRIPHWTSGAAPTKIHYCDQFNAQMYVAAEYAGPVFRHHYLDDPGVWLASTVYTTGDFRRPTVANGFRYEATTGGTSAATQPTWPTTVGGTVADNTVTWTARSFAITDVNCPHTKQVAKQAQKIFAASGPNVRYSATGDPRNWTLANDAGFFAAGLYARGSDQVTALGSYSKKSLAVFFSDNAQLWAIDPDPSLIDLTDNIESVGTIFHRSPGPVANDLMFLAQNGFRSISLIALTDNLQDNDVGSPIDPLVRPDFSPTDDPLSLYFPALGQFWSLNGAEAWVYSFSRTSKLSAWSQFDFPFELVDAAVLNQELYVRTGNDVYKVTDAVSMDGTVSIPHVQVRMNFQDAKKPGVMKQFIGLDMIGTGQATVSYLFDAQTQTLQSQAYEYPAVSEPGALYPIEICSTRIAPVVSHQKDEPFQLDAMLLHYESLGVR